VPGKNTLTIKGIETEVTVKMYQAVSATFCISNAQDVIFKFPGQIEPYLSILKSKDIDLKIPENIYIGENCDIEYTINDMTCYNNLYYIGIYLSSESDSTYPSSAGVGFVNQLIQKGKYTITFSSEGDYEVRIIYLQYPFFVIKRGKITLKVREEVVVVEKPILNIPSIEEEVNVPIYKSWKELIDDCDLPLPWKTPYITMLEANQLDIQNIKSIDTSFLQSMGIVTKNHQLIIMEKINTIKDTELKNWIRKEIQKMMN